MALASGTRLGPYEIVAPIGAGGMGEVYRARDSRLGRDVAIKVLPDDLAGSATALQRFEAEARAVAALSHPNILALHDVGEENGVRFAVTELLQGETLKTRIERGPIPPRKAVEWILQVARGLAAAHERHIVHRDIKPENLFLTHDGQVKILDFGLAKQHVAAADGQNSPTIPARTEAGFVVGTAAYMSPEQVRMQPVDGRSDIFSLGAVLFEMLSGRRPFDAPSAAETMASIAQDEPPEISDLSPAVPEGLARIVRHCLAKDPEMRFQTARDLAFALEALSGGLEVRSAATGVATGRELPVPRRARARWQTAALAAILVLAAGFAGWAAKGLFGRAPGAGPVPLSFAQLTDFPGVERQPTLSPDGKTVVYVSRNRGNEDLFLLRVGGRKPVNLTEDSDADDTAPAFSRDGTHLAFRSERAGGGIFVMEATGESVRRVTDFGYDPAWSPDGTKLVIATEAVRDPMSRVARSELWVVPVSGGSPRKITDGDAVGPKWSPHGNRIAFWGSRSETRNRDIWTMDADGRNEPIALTEDPDVDWSPAWSPDGKLLYFGSSRGGTMNLWRFPIDEASGRRLGPPEQVTTPTAWSGWFGFSADGETLVFADLDERANVWRAGFDGTAEAVLSPHEAVLRGRAIGSIDFSPAGDELVFSQRVLTWEAVGVVKTGGGGYANLTGSSFYHRVPRWSPDGERIVFYSNRDGRVKLHTIRPDGSGLATLGKTSDERLYPIWSPDGSRILAATFGGGVVFLDPGKGDAGEARLVSEALPGVVFLPTSWSVDGRRVAGMARGLGSVSPGTSGGPTRGVYAFTVPDGQLKELDAVGTGPEWLPDGRRLLFVRDGGIVLLDTATGRRRVVLPQAGLPGSWGREIALSRDGKWIAWIESLGEGDIWLATLSKGAGR